MRHCVHDVVHADAHAELREFEGVSWIIRPFPGIADVRVQRDCDHDAALIVIDSLPAWDSTVFFEPRSEVLCSGDLIAVVQIEDGVEDRIVVGNVPNGTFGKDHLHGPFEVSLLLRAMEIVGHKKSAAEQVVSKFFGLGLGQTPFSYLNSVEPGPVINLVAVIQIHGLLHGSSVDTRDTTNRLCQGAICAWIVLSPQREPFPPVTIESAAIAIERAGWIHQACERPFGRLLPVRGKRHGLVALDRWVLAKGMLCIERAKDCSGENEDAASLPQAIHEPDPCVRSENSTEM